MGLDETRDILTLAELEEVDAVTGVIDADPLGFRWGIPLG
jgi:hypothetical protein